MPKFQKIDAGCSFINIDSELRCIPKTNGGMWVSFMEGKMLIGLKIDTIKASRCSSQRSKS